jgi:cephalosporin hydroxylase
MIDLEGSLAAAHRQHAEGCVKTIEDLDRYRVVIARTQPTLIIECGTFSGRSAIWFARTAGARVVTIDVDQSNISAATRDEFKQLGIVSLPGRTADPTNRMLVSGIAWRHERVMAVLDSDHSADTVTDELLAYGSLVTPGCYCVVEDGIVRWMPEQRQPIGPYRGSPLDAIETWVSARGDQWEIDREIEDMHPTTQFPSGFLRRREPQR